eukprot:gb/GECG01016697.1/.p1 GENE.gb/GECG01016697.1/~~gb/GECG01016697.1/.p1  ORF type:complete len:289 (+),score=36.45 gb/GECG01016697.1/:1-867(+)
MSEKRITSDDHSDSTSLRDQKADCSSSGGDHFQWRSVSSAEPAASGNPEAERSLESIEAELRKVPRGNFSVDNLLKSFRNNLSQNKGEPSSAAIGVASASATASSELGVWDMSTKEFHRQLLRERGYDTSVFSGIEWLYEPRQKLVDEKAVNDYNKEVIQTVVNDDISVFERLLQRGISPDAQNKFGHTLLHLACRKGSLRVAQKLVECGVPVNVADDCGKTPLHDVCWTPKPDFKIAKLLMNNDESLARVCDRLGAVPFEYIKKENWFTWNEFLDENKETWWPPKTL